MSLPCVLCFKYLIFQHVINNFPIKSWISGVKDWINWFRFSRLLSWEFKIVTDSFKNNFECYRAILLLWNGCFIKIVLAFLTSILIILTFNYVPLVVNIAILLLLQVIFFFYLFNFIFLTFEGHIRYFLCLFSPQ